MTAESSEGRPQLTLVGDGEPATCATCGEPAAVRSAVDGAPLCTSCFTSTHWHPSWARSFDNPTD